MSHENFKAPFPVGAPAVIDPTSPWQVGENEFIHGRVGTVVEVCGHDRVLRITVDGHPRFACIPEGNLRNYPLCDAPSVTETEPDARPISVDQDEEPTHVKDVRRIAEMLRARGDHGCTVVLADGILASLRVHVGDPFLDLRGVEQRVAQGEATAAAQSSQSPAARPVEQRAFSPLVSGSSPDPLLDSTIAAAIAYAARAFPAHLPDEMQHRSTVRDLRDQLRGAFRSGAQWGEAHRKRRWPTPADEDELPDFAEIAKYTLEDLGAGVFTIGLLAHELSLAYEAGQTHGEARARPASSSNHPHDVPITEDFELGVRNEMAHQIARWGTTHDSSKAPGDWLWVLGYLANKALASHIAGNREKALHHTISSAAVLGHWHAAIRGAVQTLKVEHDPSRDLAEQSEGGTR